MTSQQLLTEFLETEEVSEEKLTLLLETAKKEAFSDGYNVGFAEHKFLPF